MIKTIKCNETILFPYQYHNLPRANYDIDMERAFMHRIINRYISNIFYLTNKVFNNIFKNEYRKLIE